MKDSADSLSYSDLKQARGNHCPPTVTIHTVSEGTVKLILLVLQELCVHRFLSTSLLLSSVSLLPIFTVHAKEKDGCAFKERFSPLTLGSSLQGECHFRGTPVSLQQGT